MRIAVCQINSTVGDIQGNVAKVKEGISKAREEGSSAVVFPEQAITGYPAEDLLYRPDFLRAAEDAARDLLQGGPQGPLVLVGLPLAREGALLNVATLGGPGSYYAKQHLPNYGVFDENRYFSSGDQVINLNLRSRTLIGERQPYGTIGVTICEDIWQPDGPMLESALAGAAVQINLSASPYALGKPEQRLRMLQQRARDTHSWIVYCNAVGGQDELVFDGNSVVLDHKGKVIAQAHAFQEDFFVVDIDPSTAEAVRMRDRRFQNLRRSETSVTTHERDVPLGKEPISYIPLPVVDRHDPEAQELYEALVLGTRDYVRKNGLKKVVIGISGGIDSALVVNIAAAALGAENVLGVTMPSQFNSRETLTDALQVCEGLGIKCLEIPIGGIASSYASAAVWVNGLIPVTHTPSPSGIGMSDFLGGVAGENLQARIRGNILMAISNSENCLVLSCGNKSEMAMGYATLYGDMVGGFNPIKDVSKTWVYRLCEYLNSSGPELIPRSILVRPPSAELAEGQQDTDSLPPYDVLDPLLTRYVEQDENIRDTELGRSIAEKVDFNEYKRRQSCPGIKVTAKAFGKDRRLPIVNKFGAPE